MHEVVIVEAGRSPVGKKNGSLAGAHPADVLGPVMMEVVKRAVSARPTSARWSAAASTRSGRRR